MKQPTRGNDLQAAPPDGDGTASNGLHAEAVAELAPGGILVAGINLSNPLLVTGRDAAGDPTGIAPDVARAVARALGVECVLKAYARPGETADGIEECGIVLIAEEAARAETIAFSAGYVQIEATYLVPATSDIETPSQVDMPGLRIVVSERSAYDLWLTPRIHDASLIRINGLRAAFEHFRGGGGDVLAGLRPALIEQSEEIRGSRVLSDSFTTVSQAIGTARGHVAGSAFLQAFVTDGARSGMFRQIVAYHGVRGLKVGT